MRETFALAIRRHGRLAFMAVVTTCLLAFALSQATRGVGGLGSATVYAFAAGFGLEFVGSAWAGRWPAGGRSRHVEG